MRYVSTRGAAPSLGFSEALLTGLAADGGLYVPTHWPALPEPSGGYAERAAALIEPFVGSDLDMATLAELCADAYATFEHPDVVPLVPFGDDQYLLELFHGPTLAFKDVALQLVGRLFDHVLAERGERVTIVGATSGDTGSAAIDGVRGSEHVDMVILYPAGRISDVQRRQMTTVEDSNVHTVAVDGTFDDCQALVKAMFADTDFRNRMRLSAVNSINWARIVAQTVYYTVASQRFDEPVSFSVPTGNFGNVLSGWIARRMGAPIRDLIVASNANDILYRFINDNDMTTRSVVPTLSPSMDIQVSSNFERLLFEMNGRDGGLTAEQLRQFAATGELSVEPDQRAEFLDGVFRADRVSDDETLAEIARAHRDREVLLDPHTATGTAAARRLSGDGPVVTLATAHPAKFPDAVERATGVRPPLPDRLSDLFERPERTVELPNELSKIQSFVEGVTQA